MALFLLKRSGYDPSSMITTISLLDMNKDDEGIMTVLSQAINTHPLIDNRVSSLQDNIFKFEKTFQSKYEVSPLPDPSLFYRVLKLFHLVFRVFSNKQIINLILFPIAFSIISPSLFYSPLLSPSFHHPCSIPHCFLHHFITSTPFSLFLPTNTPPTLLILLYIFLNHYSIIIFFAMNRSPTSSSRSFRCRYSFSFFIFPFILSNSSSYVPMSSSDRFTLDTRGCTIVSGKFTP